MSVVFVLGMVFGCFDVLEDSKGKVMYGGFGGIFVVCFGDEVFVWCNFCFYVGLLLVMLDGWVFVY